jgi:hypothetical protein
MKDTTEEPTARHTGELTKEQAAARLNIGVRQFERQVRKHGLVPSSWNGRSPRFDKESVISLGLILRAEKNAANGYATKQIVSVKQAKALAGKAAR